MDDAAALGILGTEAKGLDPGKGDRGGAHRAGLERHPQGATVEAGLAEPGCGMADRNHFGMGGRDRDCRASRCAPRR